MASNFNELQFALANLSDDDDNHSVASSQSSAATTDLSSADEFDRDGDFDSDEGGDDFYYIDKKKSRILVKDNHLYRCHRENKNGSTYWKCKSDNCPISITILGEHITKQEQGEHNHECVSDDHLCFSETKMRN